MNSSDEENARQEFDKEARSSIQDLYALPQRPPDTVDPDAALSIGLSDPVLVIEAQVWRLTVALGDRAFPLRSESPKYSAKS